MTIAESDIPNDLLIDYASHKCGFFVGAGLSMSSGFPSWKSLLLNMIEKAKSEGAIEKRKADDCRQLAEDPNKYLVLAQEMKDVLGVTFKAFLENTFKDASKAPTKTHESLVSLQNKNFIITTNYDQLIELAFVKHGKYQTGYKYYEAHAIQRQLFKREFFLLKAHGDADTSAENIILTDKDYRRILYQEPGYQSALQSIFTMYSVVFLGCSLQDPELKLFLNYINTAFPEGGIPHYALMTDSGANNVERERWRKDYNIKIINISSENDYEDINIFLNILKEKEAS